MLELSPRLRSALVADLLQEIEDPAQADRLILERRKDPREWTEHLGRQLGFHITDGPGDIHETLVLLIPELDRMLREWPLPSDRKVCEGLAEAACKHLDEYDVYATLLAGPQRWRRHTVDCTVDNLGDELRPILQRGFASSLNDMLARWTKWDIPKLRERWQEAKKRRDDEQATAALSARQVRFSERSEGARRQERDDAAKWRGGVFTPPGPTI